MESALIDGLVAHCQSTKFTGILRMRAREGMGEVWFLSGLVDEVHFGVSTGDEAMARMRQATEATFELLPRLPHPAEGFKRRFPHSGSVATATPVTLMRYCERYALTCKLTVESRDVLVEATYELGELVSVETTADDDGVTAMLEAQEGTYEFKLPQVELPAGTPVLPPASTRLDSITPPPEPVAVGALLDAKPAGGRAASDEAEVKRKTVEIARQKKAATTQPASRPPAAAAASPKAPAVDTGAEKREAEKREAEKREAEKREAEKRAAEKREADKRAAEKRAAEKREAEKREAEKRAAEKREAEKREAEKLAAEKLEAEKREAEKLAAEKLEAEKREAEKREAEKLAAEKLEAEKREAEKRKAEKREAEKREAEEREAERAAAAAEENEPAEPAAARDELEPAAPPPMQRSRMWIAVVLLAAAALAYLRWAHKI